MSKREDFIVSVLLSAHAKRVGVSRIRDFFARWRTFEAIFSVYLIYIGSIWFPLQYCTSSLFYSDPLLSLAIIILFSTESTPVNTKTLLKSLIISNTYSDKLVIFRNIHIEGPIIFS